MNSNNNKEENIKPKDFALSEKSIKKFIKPQKIANNLYFFDTVDSTFNKLSEFEPAEGLTIVAAKQTNGRGRLGRKWESGNGGIYFSFLLPPPKKAENAPFITLICALGVYRALSRYTNCGIKWPNDIVSNSKKLCGILTKTNLVGNNIESIAVGIGINANTEIFDAELKYATSLKLLCGNYIDENKLFAETIQEIDNAYYNMSDTEILSEYKKACVTLNSSVAVHFINNNSKEFGTCTDILQDGSVNVTINEKTINVNSGEVSVRGIYDYA